MGFAEVAGVEARARCVDRSADSRRGVPASGVALAAEVELEAELEPELEDVLEDVLEDGADFGAVAFRSGCGALGGAGTACLGAAWAIGSAAGADGARSAGGTARGASSDRARLSASGAADALGELAARGELGAPRDASFEITAPISTTPLHDLHRARGAVNEAGIW